MMEPTARASSAKIMSRMTACSVRARYPEAAFDAAVYRDLHRQCRDLVRDHFPHEMSVRMLLKPLALGPRIQRVALPVAVALARRLVP
jgi:hypothetical protein